MLQVFDDSNPYLHNQAYARQLQNLRWLLGSPFEVTVKIDTQHLQLNTRGDDLQDDAAERDVFFAAVHAAIAIDVLKRFVPGTSLLSTQPQLSVMLLLASVSVSLLVGTRWQCLLEAHHGDFCNVLLFFPFVAKLM